MWSGRDIDLDAWNYAIKAAGDIDRVVVVNRTAQTLRTFDAGLNFRVVSVEVPVLPGEVVHVACPWDRAKKKTPLWVFPHNVDWYVFGPSEGWCGRYLDRAVYIPQAGKAAMHAVHVASAVMFHRYGVIHGR